ncbi:ankyrin repeat domain-containing protein [Shewanella sp. AC91-MNA-CIBAN-0169]|uniref:ankyrin repeat domain-containing protein n=1 Tax=Shewanella sp. AC91-MNA-CIBAN-0169 TaxID=3140466 RepID=UPI00333052D2
MLRCLLTLCLIVFSCHSLSSEKTPFVKVTSAWNKPSLITVNDPACQSLLEDAQSKFYSDIDWGAAYGVRGHGYVNTGEILDWTILGGDSLTSLYAYGKEFYLYNYLHSGCSGACERQQSLVSTSSFIELTAKQIAALAKNAPPAMSYGYTYAQSGTNIPYMFVLGHYGADIGQLFVYRLSPNATWATACEINLTATVVPFNKEHSYFSAMKSFDDLYQSTLALSQGSGSSCGRMNTRWRWGNAIKHKLSLTLTRPWVMRGESRESKNSHGNYSKMITDLERWSLTGVAEQKAFNGYKHQLAISIKSLSQFYQQANHWYKQQSDEIAELALTSAISAGFGFYMYNPEFSAGEFNLRNAIITKQSLDTIKTIEFSAIDIDSIAKTYYSQEAQESILNLAINQPEVLKYLLQQGISPNHSNAFGKTPLMYAAQYNLLKSAKLLIQHGANTVANTTIPQYLMILVITR